jgi:hypothetical protein
MKKIVMLICLVTSLLVSVHASMAYSVTTVGGNDGYGPFQTGGGGEFTLKAGDGLSVPGNYAAVAKDQYVNGTFQSFCLEKGEYIYPNSLNYVTMGDAARNGGIGGPSPDPISLGTAYLYQQFATGVLSGYD